MILIKIILEMVAPLSYYNDGEQFPHKGDNVHLNGLPAIKDKVSRLTFIFILDMIGCPYMVIQILIHFHSIIYLEKYTGNSFEMNELPVYPSYLL